MDYYGKYKGAAYIKNLEDFGSGANRTQVEFHFFFMVSKFQGEFVVYLDKDTSRLKNAEVYSKYDVRPDPNSYQREGIVFTTFGEVKIGTLVNHTLNGGRGRRYFFRDTCQNFTPRIELLGDPSFCYDGNNFELIESLLTEQIFSKPLVPDPTWVIEGDSHGRDYISEAEGVIRYSNGSSYTGEMKLDERCGTGTMLYANGESYTGEWFGGLKHGEGVYRWPNGDFREGTWVLNKMDNRGTIHLSSGEIYSGIWRAGNLIDGYYEKVN